MQQALLFFLCVGVAHFIIFPHKVESGPLSKIPLIRWLGVHHILRFGAGEQARRSSHRFRRAGVVTGSCQRELLVCTESRRECAIRVGQAEVHHSLCDRTRVHSAPTTRSRTWPVPSKLGGRFAPTLGNIAPNLSDSCSNMSVPTRVGYGSTQELDWVLPDDR